MTQWGNIHRDRKLGDIAEREAETHFRQALWLVQRHPLGVKDVDMLVTSRLGRGDSHFVEVRCKAPTRDRCYGLEETKLELWRERDVLYLIKDREREGWYLARMAALGEPVSRRKSFGSYLNGRMDYKIQNVFWPIQWWLELPWEYQEL